MGSNRKVSKQVVGAYPVEFRMKVVKLFLEEDYSVIMLSEEFGCSKSIINSWVRAYRKYGEQGLYSPSTCHKKASKLLNSKLKSQIKTKRSL